MTPAKTRGMLNSVITTPKPTADMREMTAMSQTTVTMMRTALIKHATSTWPVIAVKSVCSHSQLSIRQKKQSTGFIKAIILIFVRLLGFSGRSEVLFSRTCIVTQRHEPASSESTASTTPSTEDLPPCMPTPWRQPPSTRTRTDATRGGLTSSRPHARAMASVNRRPVEQTMVRVAMSRYSKDLFWRPRSPPSKTPTTSSMASCGQVKDWASRLSPSPDCPAAGAQAKPAFAA
mmetsp:Transcript_93124/g.226209  ORF Transcript_93124/g.226209 Transcript_93124/m.226209 type:complete len:233 (+) Transcript_93124:173-871(+)